MTTPHIARGYTPGLIGRVSELHATYYSAQWGFGAFFEARVATDMAAFVSRYDETRDCIWTATIGGRIEGTISIDGIRGDEAEGAHLRWFIMSDALRGQGLGGKLVNKTVAFCRAKGYRRVFLWTFEGLDAARHLYEQAGFELVETFDGHQWGTPVKEQRFVAELI
ncbi:MAG: GNAT family N-acetyltransferase [Chromatiales bacterium]|jgi:GNAT superfamily N-acetyltransferase|nr:GNAT family N-acetyltransferase [Chromatiales bacterium]